jgi:putative ABC transport system substrate-binding protein
MAVGIGRRQFISVLGGTAVARPLDAWSQQPMMPVIGYIAGGSGDVSARFAAAFRKGLNETGFVEGQSVTVEYNYLEGQYERLPTLMADLVRRKVAVIVAGFQPAALAAKTATATIPIVFGVAQDPVGLGLVASLATPGGNATNQSLSVTATTRLMLIYAVPRRLRLEKP